MKMSPADGLVADPAETWVLADPPTDTVLLYSLKSSSITLLKALPHARYDGLWFGPNTGTAKPLMDISAAVGTPIPKPDERDWLLLLTTLAH